MHDPQLVFVYGTLKRGQDNHHLLEKANYIGKAHTLQPKWQMFSLGAFPGVVEGDKEIYGEVYQVGFNGMNSLDHLEGHPSFYERKLVDVGIYGGKKGDECVSKAWMYIFKGDTTDCMPLRNWT